MLRHKDKAKIIKIIFLLLLIPFILLPIYLFFQENPSSIENIRSCETYASNLKISSEKVFRLSQLNREYSLNYYNNIQKINVKPYLIKNVPSSLKCIGKIWLVDLEKNVIYVASNNLIFQVFKLIGYIFILLCLIKSRILNLFNLTIVNLIFTISLNYIFNFKFRFFSDLKYYASHLEILDSVIISLVFFGLIKFFEKDNNIKNVSISLNFIIKKNIYIYISFLYLIRILYLFSTPFQNTDVIQEWLINYNYGFIRRGLFGTLIIEIMTLLNLNLQIFMNIFIIFLYSIFCLLFFRLLKNKTFDFYSLLILFSPFFINYNLFIKSTILLPKELLGFISLIIFLLFQNTNKKTLLVMFILTYLVSILAHEVNLILLPTIFYISYVKSPIRINKKTFLLIFVLSIFLLLLIINSDTVNKIESICLETYNKYTPNMGCRKSEILNTNILDNFETVKLNIFSSDSYKYYLSTYALTLLLGFIPFILNGWVRKNVLYIALLLLSFSSLSLIGLDWGRWINIIFTHLSIYFIYFDLEKYKKNKIDINRFFQTALILIYVIYWSAPQCCVNEYTFNSQIGHIYNNFTIYLIFIILILLKSKNLKIYKFLQLIVGTNSIKKHNSE